MLGADHAWLLQQLAPSAELPLLLQHIQKVYASGAQRKVAVKDLSLALHHGQCFGLLGENGAGKTTSISMISIPTLPPFHAMRHAPTLGAFDPPTLQLACSRLPPAAAS